jgi:putative DNA methylase
MHKKKLIEVALPLETINAACKSDKDRKTGTIRNVHKWFAPMPVPALRALIFASLVDDPGDDAERVRLLGLIDDLVAAGVDSPSPKVAAAARAAIHASVGDATPIVLDPFCGGGSTLVEAQRLGLRSRGSDLNPIPVLISKVLTELPPTVVNRPPLHDDTLGSGAAWPDLSGYAADVQHYAERIRAEAHRRIGQLYPPAAHGEPVIAWWWARTVESPDPRYQGHHVPLVNSWWLAKKKGQSAFVEPVVDAQTRQITYRIATAGEPTAATKGSCLLSGAPLPFSYVRDKGLRGELGTTMLAVVAHGPSGRRYLPPDTRHMAAAMEAQPLETPSLPLPDKAIGFRVQGYGMASWSDLFSVRQQVALETFAALVREVPGWVREDGGDEQQARAVTTLLGLCVGKLAQFSSTQCLWKIDSRNGTGKAESAKFGRNDVPMCWDYVETNPFGGSVGDWMQIVETASRALAFVDATGPAAAVSQLDARTAGGDLTGQCLVVTDPPYFSAIGYANLSDYFYIWVRAALRDVYPDLLATLATPKVGELIAEPARHESEGAATAYFINGFTETFDALKAASSPDLPILIVYASKEQEADQNGHAVGGWEAMLEAVIRSRLSIVGTWPIHGTGSTRMRGLNSNALATYVVLVCRPKPDGAERISRSEFVTELRSAIGPAVRVLQSAAIAPVDLAQAVIGPGMAVFTKYDAVVGADGAPMAVLDAQRLINAVLAEVLGEQEQDWEGETRWAVTWFEQRGFDEGDSGEADALARAKVTTISGLVHAGLVKTGASRTRLLRRDELPADYDPTSDRSPTIWEAVQHMVRELETGGEMRAADLLRRLPYPTATRELAYRLYAVCDAKKWAKEATAYNALVTSWAEITRLAAAWPNDTMSGPAPTLFPA